MQTSAKRGAATISCVRLEPVATSHAHDLERCLREPEVARGFRRGGSLTVEERVRRFVEGWTWGYENAFAIIEDAGAGVVGVCTVGIMSHSPLVAQLGYWITPSRWGRGLATQATTAVVDFAFRERAIERLEASTRRDNEASIRILVRLGFCLSDEASSRDGESLYYFLDRHDWANANEGR